VFDSLGSFMIRIIAAGSSAFFAFFIDLNVVGIFGALLTMYISGNVATSSIFSYVLLVYLMGGFTILIYFNDLKRGARVTKCVYDLDMMIMASGYCLYYISYKFGLSYNLSYLHIINSF
jgi:hypothetical protein